MKQLSSTTFSPPAFYRVLRHTFYNSVKTIERDILLRRPDLNDSISSALSALGDFKAVESFLLSQRILLPYHSSLFKRFCNYSAETLLRSLSKRASEDLGQNYGRDLKLRKDIA